MSAFLRIAAGVAAVAVLAGAFFIGRSAGWNAAAYEYEQRINSERAEHEKQMRAIVAAAEAEQAARRTQQEKELAELRRRDADNARIVDGLRDKLEAYRNQPMPDAAACVIERNRFAELATRSAGLLVRAERGLVWCDIELRAAGAVQN